MASASMTREQALQDAADVFAHWLTSEAEQEAA